MSKLKVTIGCDPEAFLRDNNTGLFISAHDKLPGTKEDPFKVKKGAIQVDGVAAEINIDPASSSDEFVGNVRMVQTQLQDMIPGITLITEPVAIFEPGYWKSIPGKAKELGCDPDFNAWTREVNPPPPRDRDSMRTGAGHIHIGWRTGADIYDPNHFEDCINVVKQMDYVLGLYSLMWDADPRRRSLYGKAGAFRPKAYGCEYRVLSNVWLRSDRMMTWIFNTAYWGINVLADGRNFAEEFSDYAKLVIDNNEVEWNKTSRGKTIAQRIGIGNPPWQECISKPELSEIPVKEPVVRKKKVAKHIYGVGPVHVIGEDAAEAAMNFEAAMNRLAHF
jgi:hypothetical protein